MCFRIYNSIRNFPEWLQKDVKRIITNQAEKFPNIYWVEYCLPCQAEGIESVWHYLTFSWSRTFRMAFPRGHCTFIVTLDDLHLLKVLPSIGILQKTSQSCFWTQFQDQKLLILETSKSCRSFLNAQFWT